MSMMENKGSKKIAAMSFFWNAVYSGLNAIQSAVILFAISRTRALGEAGIITIGFTLATLANILGRYGVRNYQVTDVHEEYSFSDYYYLRLVSVGGTTILFLLYLLILTLTGNYSSYKGIVVFEVVLLKMVDAFEGLYVGRLQQKGRLDIGAKIASIRLIVSTAVIFILLWFVKSLPLCLLAGIVVSAGLDLALLDRSNWMPLFKTNTAEWNKVRILLKLALPLCLGHAMHNYLGNAPKYLVDMFVSDEMQAVSGYVMMPMFVITLLNTFLMQPMVRSLGEAWDRRESSRLAGMIRRHILLIALAAVMVLALGIWAGLPALSWMYHTELTQYKKEFIWLMAGGTLYTLSSYGIVLLTTIRKQRWIIAGCCFALVPYLLFGKTQVALRGLEGAAELYTFTNSAMLITFLLVFVIVWRRTFGGSRDGLAASKR